MRSNNNEGCGVVKIIIEVIRVPDDKKVKWRYLFNNKLIIFTYY